MGIKIQYFVLWKNQPYNSDPSPIFWITPVTLLPSAALMIILLFTESLT